ncbi:MAG: hypothetical protein JSW73_03495 [Candidatus Woesearchaeota archaeon]|nr:MAG: hypothetical protein JSW73_03495 [Candidatus Woesearchaeota archaeon]
MNKKNKKGVSVILSLVIIIGIILVSVLFAYRWGVPIMETNKDTIELRDITSKFPELKSKVDVVSMEGNLSSRKINFQIKRGSLIVDENEDLFRYTLEIGDRLCDEVTMLNLTLNKSTSVPSGVTSLSGEIFKENHTLDNDTRHIIVADTENRWEYDDLYIASLQNSSCFERYTFDDMIITEDNKFGIFFSHVKEKGNEMDAIFTPTAKKEDNIYHICGSGASLTDYTIYLKYKNPVYTGSCDNIEHFDELDIIGSAHCREQCSLVLTNKGGKIEVRKV